MKKTKRKLKGSFIVLTVIYILITGLIGVFSSGWTWIGSIKYPFIWLTIQGLNYLDRLPASIKLAIPYIVFYILIRYTIMKYIYKKLSLNKKKQFLINPLIFFSLYYLIISPLRRIVFNLIEPVYLNYISISGAWVIIGGLCFLIFTKKEEKENLFFEKDLDEYDNNMPEEIDFEKYKKNSERIAEKKGYDFTFLGYNSTKDHSAIVFDSERKKHIQILGSTGTGKTHFAMLPMIKQDIKKGRGVIFIDAKGDIETAKTVYKICKDNNRQQDFQMFSMNNIKQSNTYNPLLLGNATQLKDKVINTIPMTEPHYERECETALQILFNDYFKKHDTINLKKLYEILMNPTDKYPKFLDYYMGHKKNLSGLYNEIGLLVNTEFGELFNGNNLDLLNGYKNQKIMYFGLNVLAYGKSGRRLGKLITGDINTLCGILQNTEKKERKDFGIYIDEYKEFGTKSFANALTQGRSVNFMITIAHQSAGDLKAISKYHPEQVKANTNTRIVLKTNDNDTAFEFANEIGKEKYIKMSLTESINANSELSSSVRKNVDDKNLISEQIIKKLDVGQAVFKTPSDYGLIKLKPLFYDTRDININLSKKTGKEEPETKEENKSTSESSPDSILDI